MSRIRGFTLIELLVVIAIIALLLSVITATLSNARAKARDTKRIAELHQIFNAMQLYADANGGIIPQATANYSNASSTSPYCGSNASCWDDLTTQLAPYFPRMPKDPYNSYPYAYYYRPLGYNSCPTTNGNLPVIVFAAEANTYPGMTSFSAWTGSATTTFYCMFAQ